MVRHKAKLSFLLLGLSLSSGIANGKIVRDCEIIKQAQIEGVRNPQLVLAIAKVESDKREKVRNGQHYGMMQLKLATARMIGFKGKPSDLLNWKVNLKFASKYLDQQLERYNQSLTAAVAAYNAGTAFICKKGRGGCKKGTFVNQGYVNRVMRNYNEHFQC